MPNPNSGSADHHATPRDLLFTRESFFRALQIIESGGCEKPEEALGDGGLSLGPLQIKECYWQDSAIPEAYDQVKRIAVAERCVDGFMRRYVPSSWKSLMTLEECQLCARVHNGGPSLVNQPDGAAEYVTKFTTQLLKLGGQSKTRLQCYC